MAYGVGGPDSRIPWLAAETGVEQAAYSEVEDEAATALVEVMLEPPKWLVQITPFDRRMMETAQLVTELLDGALVRGDTLVWRGGMSDWVPIGEIQQLLGDTRHGATLPPRAAVSSDRRNRPFAELLAAVAVAISIAAGTLTVLARGGVFEPSAASRRIERATGQRQRVARNDGAPQQRRAALRARGPEATHTTSSSLP